jgi:nicotinate-nucleotide pyrophosphorylase (carboxylating)
MNFSDGLCPEAVQRLVREWLREDIPSFDVGGMVVGNEPGKAILWMKQSGVVAGGPFFDAVFSILGCAVEWKVQEGQEVRLEGGRVEAAVVTGPMNRLLQGERSALNCLARVSGIATSCRALVELAKEAKWHGRVAGTRKTTPGFRLCEKYGMSIGGADTHRYDLSSMVMLKDNHIAAHGSITGAVQRARSAGGFSLRVEVECSNADEAVEAAQAGADVVMLDNLAGQKLRDTVSEVRRRCGATKVVIEASGGITASTIKDYLCEHVDVVSMGGITQGAQVVDFSLKIQPAVKK